MKTILTSFCFLLFVKILEYVAAGEEFDEEKGSGSLGVD